MKILIITRTVAEFGNIHGKLREMARLGVEITVLSPSEWGGKDRELRSVRADGYRLLIHKCMFAKTRSVRVGNHLHFYPGISEIIGRGNWDLVHIDEEPFNFATFHALRACREHQRQAVFTTWQNLMKHYPPPFCFFERYAYKHVAGAIAGNIEGLDLLRRRKFIKPAVQIPQLGIDPKIFCKRDASYLRERLQLKDAFAIGFVGRFSAEKGIETLIKSVALLPKDCVLVLLGSGPLDSALKHLVLSLGISSRVRWVPWVDSPGVAEYMNAFDVIVLPSRTRWNIKEQFGRVLVEGMACEKPVIGSDSGEIPRVIGDAGLIFHEDRERELTECLRRLMATPSLKETLGRRGRDRVLTHYTYSRIAEETVEFYKKICDSKGHTQPSTLSMVSA